MMASTYERVKDSFRKLAGSQAGEAGRLDG